MKKTIIMGITLVTSLVVIIVLLTSDNQGDMTKVGVGLFLPLLLISSAYLFGELLKLVLRGLFFAVMYVAPFLPPLFVGGVFVVGVVLLVGSFFVPSQWTMSSRVAGIAMMVVSLPFILATISSLRSTEKPKGE